MQLPHPPANCTGWPWTEETPQLADAMPDGSPWPRVSIVTPSYNQGEFVEETIRSVLLQHYPNLEYLVMDGGSTDGSVETIRKYEPWLSHWVSEKDRGQSHAINKGWERCSGAILGWLNSDDILAPNALAIAVTAMYRVGVAWITGAQYVGARWDDAERRYNLKTPTRHQMLRGERTLSQSSTFFCRELLSRAGLLDERLHFTMDYDLWCRMLLIGEAPHVVEDVLSLARLQPGMKTQPRNRHLAVQEREPLLRRNLGVTGYWALHTQRVARRARRAIGTRISRLLG